MRSHLRPILHILALALIALVSAAATTAAAALSELEKNSMIQSDQKAIVRLDGEWERSTDGEVWSSASLPASEGLEGKYFYRKKFLIDQRSLDTRVWHLYFAGVQYKASISVNGQYLTSHTGGMVPFTVDIPRSALLNGSNELMLEVSNELDPFRTLPVRQGLFDTKNYGGIYQSLYLYSTPQLWVSGLDSRSEISKDRSSATLRAVAQISSGSLEKLFRDVQPALGKDLQIQVSGRLLDLETEQTVSAAQDQTVSIQSDRTQSVTLAFGVAAPKLWSPQTPSRYLLVVTLSVGGEVLDTYKFFVGISTLSVARGGRPRLLVNGEPLALKAVDYVEDISGSGKSMSGEQYERDIQMLKTLGANAVRVRGGLPSPLFAELCSRYGLLILSELPFSNVPYSTASSEELINTAENMLREMQTSLGWQPCLAAWGVGSARQFPETFLQRLKARHNEFAPGRLLYCVRTDGTLPPSPSVDFTVVDFSFIPTDKIAPRLQKVVAQYQGLPFALLFGKPVASGNHEGYSHPLSAEAQAKFIRDCYRTMEENTVGIGAVIWSFNDYAVSRPMMIVGPKDWGTATVGLVDGARETRLSYDVVKALFNGEREPVISAGSYVEAVPYFFTIISIIILLLFAVLVNSNRRFREHVGRALFRPYNFFADIRDQRILSNVRTFLLALLLAASPSVVLSGLLYFYRSNVAADSLLVMLLPSDSVKLFLVQSVWEPWMAMLVFSLLHLVLFAVVAVFIRTAAIFVSNRIFFSDAFTITIWGSLPLITLPLIAIGLYQILNAGPNAVWILGGSAAVWVWVLYRAFRGISVIFDVWSMKVYAVGIVFLIAFVGSIAMVLDARTGAMAGIAELVRQMLRVS